MTRLLTRHLPTLALAALVLMAAAVMARPLPVTAAELIMFEQRGCEWCERWNAEIGPIYPKTEEGRLAPLRRVDIHEKMPEDLRWLRPEVFTPSFALIHEGREYGRIRGYPGEDFFWGLLAQMVEKYRQAAADAAAAQTQRPAPGQCPPSPSQRGRFEVYADPRKKAAIRQQADEPGFATIAGVVLPRRQAR